jgi:hypothetical protein
VDGFPTRHLGEPRYVLLRNLVAPDLACDTHKIFRFFQIFKNLLLCDCAAGQLRVASQTNNMVKMHFVHGLTALAGLGK